MPSIIRFKTISARIEHMSGLKAMPGKHELIETTKHLARPIKVVNRHFQQINEYGTDLFADKLLFLTHFVALGSTETGHYDCVVPYCRVADVGASTQNPGVTEKESKKK